MPYYLSPYVGKGTYAEPFRPREAQEHGVGAHAIDLRADCTKAEGYALLWLESAVPVHRSLVKLGDAADDTHGWSFRRYVRWRLGHSHDARDVRQLVRKLLLQPPAGAWNPLVGREIHLGPETFHLPPAIAGGATVTETFDAADSDTLGPVLTWAEIAGDWDIVSNQALSGTGTPNVARAERDMDSVDHAVTGTLTNPAAPSDSVGVFCRKDATADLTYYGALVDCKNFSPPNGQWRTFKYSSGAFTAIGADTGSVIWVPNDTIAIDVVGSSIRRRRNGSIQDTVTDSSIAGGLRGGLWAWFTSAPMTVDNVVFNPMTPTGGAAPADTYFVPFGRHRGRR